MSTKRRQRSRGKGKSQQIPRWVRAKEAARRLAQGFLNDLRDKLGQPSKSSCGSGKRNPWPKCIECFHRKPPEGVCIHCKRCLPGCCPGPCDNEMCERCADHCPGHRDDEEGQE